MTTDKTGYVILDAASTGELEDAVRSMLDVGFIPVGGLAITHTESMDTGGAMHDEFIYFQAMVRHEPSA